MKLLSPIITIQNVDGGRWLCSVDHQHPTNGERISLSVLLRKDPALTPAEIYELVLQEALANMGKMISRNAMTGKKPPRSP